MPLFFALVCGMIDYGWFFYQRYAMAVAVRDGIRVGLTVLETATPDCWTTAKNRAIVVLQTSNTIPNPDTSITWGPASNQYTGAIATHDRALTLSAAYTYKPLVGFVRMPAAGMHYSMTMLIESED